METVKSMVMTGRRINGSDNPEENCTSLAAGVFWPLLPAVGLSPVSPSRIFTEPF